MAQPVTLAGWQSNGYYVVHATTRRTFQLTVPSADFGGALLTDVECLLDHATEHQATIWASIRENSWVSPAWLAVTVYYWSFYLAQALGRLTGDSAWFLSRDTVRNLRTLGPSAGTAPSGAGCFRVICGPSMTAIDRLVVLTKTDARIHEEIWRRLFLGCEARLALTPHAGSIEGRTFTAIVRSARHLGDCWPSDFRNAVNYRPGFAYAEIRRTTVLKALAYLKQPPTYDFATVLARLETAVVENRGPSAIDLNPQGVLELLVNLAFLLHAITHELHRELVDRHNLDSRWRLGRQRFLRTRGVLSGGQMWPL
jgi:hypothetical protein